MSRDKLDRGLIRKGMKTAESCRYVVAVMSGNMAFRNSCILLHRLAEW